MVDSAEESSSPAGQSSAEERSGMDISETPEGAALAWCWRLFERHWRAIAGVGALLVLIGAALPWYAYGNGVGGVYTERSVGGFGNMFVGFFGGLTGALLVLDRTADAGRPPLRGTFLLGLLLSTLTMGHLVRPWWFSGGPNRDGFGVLHVETGLHLAAIGSLLIALAPAIAAVVIATDAE